MTSLMEKMSQTGAVKASALSESVFFTEREVIPTKIPAFNIGLGGSLSGGITSGLMLIAGESKSFKTLMGLSMVKAFLDHDSEAICVYYDSEFGSTDSYIKALKVDPGRVLHVPIEDIEDLQFDIVKKLEAITRKDKVFFFVDSIGMLASKKEAEDALAGKSVTDMTRAKALKSLMRIITPKLTIKNVNCIMIAHTYDSMDFISVPVVSGGQGIYLSANTIWIITRSQEKDSDNKLVGYNFTINVEKSRFVKEKSKIQLNVHYEKGINKYSGLLDLAVDSGVLIKERKGTSNQFYAVDDKEKTYSTKEVYNKELWEPILKNKDFIEFVEKKYKLKTVEMVQE